MKINKLLCCIFLCLGCSTNTNPELERIKLNEVFTINKNKYIVLFYSSTCEACINSLEVLNRRMEIRKYVGFCVNLNDEDIIYSIEKESNLNKKYYLDLVFVSVPYLVYIEEKRIVKEVYGNTNIHKENLYIFFE